MSTRHEEAKAILRGNDRGGYTVPTAGLYPFQWNWDSAFCAIGFATFDEPRGWDELDTLFLGQWADGMVPHIVFHQPSDTYFPGPDVWGTSHTPPTSGITQPPVAATAALRMLQSARDPALANERCAQLYPKLLSNHRWWASARDPDNTGLVAVLHNWETGMDNSPAWDLAFERVPRTDNPYVRKDLGHVDSAMRPRAIDYDRYVHLVETYRACQWQPEAMWKAAPFKIAHIGINAILLRAEMDLLVLAGHFGTESEATEIKKRIARMEKAIASLWSEKLSAYQSLDLISGKPIDKATNAGFLPLLTNVPDAAKVASMVQEMARWAALSKHSVATVSPDDPDFDSKRYWRGPIWGIVNWLLADGLRHQNRVEESERLRKDTARLILDHGFPENFDPMDGAPGGGHGFSWTAAVALAFALK
ncbi:MAG: amylo-alpha-1,6-glucosidase [Beijerinckiaceae bacterium]